MLKVKDGDIQKMGLLYERYYRQLYCFFLHMTRGKELSEDMIQNVFLRMLKYRKAFTGSGEFRIWMYHVARNLILDHHKKNSKTPSHNSLQLKDFEERISGGQLTDDQLDRQQKLELLETAMNNLSYKNRELLVMCRYQKLRYSEIARVLNITEGAVKVRIHRALNELKSNYLKIEN